MRFAWQHVACGFRHLDRIGEQNHRITYVKDRDVGPVPSPNCDGVSEGVSRGIGQIDRTEDAPNVEHRDLHGQ
jgi:hypothetical protein